jgi:hypothetical protein
MIVNLTDEEIRILRSLLIGRELHTIPVIARQRIVLKLHAALEEMRAEEASKDSRTVSIQ